MDRFSFATRKGPDMADIDKIAVNNTTYNIKDSTARDSISHIGMKMAASLSLPDNATPPDFYSVFGQGLSAVWVSSSSLGTPATYGTLITACFTQGDAMQMFVSSSGYMYFRTSISQSQTWRNWQQVTLQS